MDHWLLQHQDCTSHDAVTPLTLLMKLLLILDLHDGEHCKIYCFQLATYYYKFITLQQTDFIFIR